MKRFILFIVIALMLSSCSLKSPNARFIMNMDTTVSYNETVEQHKHDESRFMLDRYFTGVEEKGEVDLHHYKIQRYADGICYYHFVVNRNTKKVVGWAFDKQLGDPKWCGNAG